MCAAEPPPSLYVPPRILSIHPPHVCSYDRGVVGAPTFVEFSADLENAPPPNHLLLALHATCAHVANMSGIAQLFNELEQCMEMEIFSSGGASTPLLGERAPDIDRAGDIIITFCRNEV